MTASCDPEKIDRLFDALCDLPAEERARRLDAEVDDPDARRQLERLFAHYSAPRFTAAPLLSPRTDDVPQREVVGPYRIQQVLGAGGMGIVYLAERERGDGERVALKVLRPGATRTHGRFRREAEVLRRLDHPGICRFLEYGEAPEPYFAMEYVRGEPLLEHARKHHLDDRAKLELVARVCDAIHHAHGLGIVHRDLKPSNVLVVPGSGADPVGSPKVLDFGIARAVGLDPLDLATVTETRTGALMGTLGYMSPEQVAGDVREIDARSDVYSLGVILFELLTQSLPYRIDGLPVPQVVRVIQDEEPSRLGSKLDRLRGSLEDVVGKALEKDPERRYATAAEFAGDLRRFLRGEPVVARHPTLSRQVWKFTRRHRVLTATTLGTFLALALGLVVALRFALAEAREHRIANENAKAAQRAHRRACLEAAGVALREGDAHAAKAELDVVPEHLRGWEWSVIRSWTDVAELVLQIDGVDSPLAGRADLAFRSDGTLCASVFDAAVGKTRYGVWEVPSGRRLDTGALDGWAVLGQDGGAVALDGTELVVYGVPGPVRRESFEVGEMEEDPVLAMDGSTFFVADTRRSIRIDTSSGTLEELAPLELRTSLVLHEASGFATCAWYGLFDRFSLDEPTSVQRAIEEYRHSLPAALAPDGASVAHPRGDGRVSLWRYDEPDGPRLEAILGEKTHGTTVAEFSPDGTLLAFGGEAHAVHLYSTGTFERVATFAGHETPIVTLAFSPDGRWLAAGTLEGTVRVFDLLDQEPEVVRVGDYVYTACFDPSGKWILIGTLSGDILFHDARSLERFARVHVLDGTLADDIAFDERRRRAFVSQREQETVVLDLETARVVGTLDSATRSLSMTPDGESLLCVHPGSQVAGAAGRSLRMYGTRTLERVAESEVLPIGAVARIDPTGRWIGVGGPDDTVWLFETEGLVHGAELRGHTDEVFEIAFSMDGSRVATTSRDTTVRIWSVPDGNELALLTGHTRLVHAAAWSPDGTRLFTSSRDNTIKVWDTRNWEELATFLGHEDYVHCLDVHQDGRSLLSAGGDGTVRLWDVRSRHELREEARAYRESAGRLATRVAELVPLAPAAALAQLEAPGSLDAREREIAVELLFGMRAGGR